MLISVCASLVMKRLIPDRCLLAVVALLNRLYNGSVPVLPVQRVRVVNTAAEAVAGCAYVGKVVVSGPGYTFEGGWAGAMKDREILRKEQTVHLGGDTLLRIGNDEDDAYRCLASTPVKEQSSASAPSVETVKCYEPRSGNPIPCQTSLPGGKKPAASKIRIVGNEDDVRGCVFIDSVDQGIDCPEDYPAGVPCMGFRASLQGGNTVLARGGGKVYSCPPGQ